ncbi:hypothetical protein MSTE_04594 [Mycobacteroides stephanolepidis]|uniref:Uncharacterized protein n=1 Tax=[Mycobacterium] stephanolepidis TaxID=1520670 RepID=A0A1Z4F3U5_9MYCO|nr:hypothetical protein MSTE_04594 [[Mycobacterium] stephanolepidis]
MLRRTLWLVANAQLGHYGQHRNMGDIVSVADIRTAIKELSLRADLADDARELRDRIRGYQEELAKRP